MIYIYKLANARRLMFPRVQEHLKKPIEDRASLVSASWARGQYETPQLNRASERFVAGWSLVGGDTSEDSLGKAEAASFLPTARRYVVLADSGRWLLDPKDGKIILQDVVSLHGLASTVTSDKSGRLRVGGYCGYSLYKKFWWLFGPLYRNLNCWCYEPPVLSAHRMLRSRLPGVIASIKQQLSKAPHVKALTVVPTYLRYISDGHTSENGGTQQGYVIASHKDGPQNGHPVLYDGPAFAVWLRIHKSRLPGLVYVDKNADFICSHWCQRQSYDDERIDLVSPHTIKYSLLTWVLGPGEHFAPAGKTTARIVSVAKLGKSADFNVLFKIALLRQQVLDTLAGRLTGTVMAHVVCTGSNDLKVTVLGDNYKYQTVRLTESAALLSPGPTVTNTQTPLSASLVMDLLNAAGYTGPISFNNTGLFPELPEPEDINSDDGIIASDDDDDDDPEQGDPDGDITAEGEAG